jgi:putative Holliday junction resolvase
VDLGTKRIGLALSDSEGLIASPLLVLHRQGGEADYQEIGQIVRDYEVDVVVVGMPLNLRGQAAEAAQNAQREIEALRQLVGVPVEVCDERLTSVVAERGLRAGGLDGRQRRQVVDKVAATVLLQSYLERKRQQHGPTA